jgi:Glycine zipper
MMQRISNLRLLKSEPNLDGIRGTKRERDMKRSLVTAAFLGMAALMPGQQASAQDPVAGAIVGGALGGIIGGAVGRGAGGAVAGAVIGATTGAVIASEAQRRNSGYYFWRGGCYYRYPNGSWLQVQPGYC